MAFNVSLLPEALTDYDEAIEWYEKERHGLGLRLYLEMEETIQQIAHHPMHYTFFVEHYRDAALKSFPYRIIFNIQAQEIIVLAIFHTSRSETEIYKRLK
jgi:plasmid stabilization system protein ParE